jgi:hypothetical protein
MGRLYTATDLTTEELIALRLVVERSFMSASSFSSAQRTKLLEMGLIQRGMGGLMPTPAGRLAARV